MPHSARRWNGRLWPHGREPSSWSSRGLATAITVVAFVAAFVAMRTVRSLRLAESRSRETVAVVRLAPPVERVETPKAPGRARVRAPTVPIRRGVSPPAPTGRMPTDSAAGAPPARPIASPFAPPLIPLSPVIGGDSTKSGGTGAPGSPSGGARGAPYAPAGMTTPSSSLTEAQKDSIRQALLARIPADEWHRPLTPTELAEVRRRREPGLDPHGRAARLPGEPMYAPLMNGGYAVAAPLISIPLPFGKSRAQRKADSIIDADYQARLIRLQQRLARQRAIAKADSVRRDSLLRVGRRP